MKTSFIHSVSILISFIGLILINHTVNPISLKGPHFLKFYLILVFGLYASIFALKLSKEVISETTFYFMISIFVLGVIKLTKGILLGKPVGFLITILIMECIAGIVVMNRYFKNKINK